MDRNFGREKGPDVWLESLADQYDSQIALLTKAGLLYEGQGMDGVGNTYPYPNDIGALIEKNRALYETKYRQGFTKLLIVPLKTPLVYFIDAYASLIQKHRSEGTLKDSKGNVITKPPADGHDVWVWETLKEADEKSNLFYFPQEFSEDPKTDGGVTKAELPPFRIVLVEDSANIAFPGEGKSSGQGRSERRKQFETNMTPEESIETMLWNKHYDGESGFTPEIAIIDAITRLEETQTVTDDASVGYHLGSYLMPEKLVTYLRWDEDESRAVLSANDMTREYNFGPRTAVVIG